LDVTAVMRNGEQIYCCVRIGMASSPLPLLTPKIPHARLYPPGLGNGHPLVEHAIARPVALRD
jgi:hypothetical protein